ncbi:Pentatricopeptide repeat-containing protein [Melia azedarach]|uniref:Pentatricopeptide repeat-containing protein n=1 Tax=Melia azedarach TaxID=155640 RepID=A0ACC1YG50_MELAZ|nr:Pentatricopeptide repeat-containing protein [Melia azedarach]
MFCTSGPFLKLTKTLCLTLTRRLSHKIQEIATVNQGLVSPLNLKPINAKISNLMRNALIPEAQELFDKMPQRNTVTWNAMIRGYFRNGLFDKAISLFNQMPERDIFTYNTVIAGLMQSGDVNGAKEVFDRMVDRDVIAWNSMISGYVRNGLIDEAIGVFHNMPGKDVVSWNLLIGGLLNNQRIDLAETYFKEMTARDVVSWTIMVSGLSRAGRIVEARELFEEMPVKDVQAWNVMITGYVENGCLDMAEDLFKKMPIRDLNSWKQLINGLVNSRRIGDAVRNFMQMPEKCRKTWNSIILGFIRNGLVKEAHAHLEKYPYSNTVSCTNVIVGYFEIGEVGSAIKVFEFMTTRDVTVWNVMVFGLGENDLGEEGLKFFVRMKESGPAPDEATFTSVLTICSDLPTLHLGKQTHVQTIKTSFNQFTAVSNAMVTMYARCGNMQSALLEFSSMPTHDVISWNSIICGFAHHGDASKALEMFERMLLTDIKPNDITFVGVLSVCSYAGLVDQGRYYFDYMKNKCFIQPTTEHYTCVVDLLGRFGLIDEAMGLLNQIRADGIEVPPSVWGALLGSCRIHNNTKVGKIAGEKVLELEPHNSGVYLILAEMYLSSGRREDAERIWARMKESGVKKQPGCSWIEINNSGHVFLSGDSSHSEFHRLCCLLNLLHMEMETKTLKPSGPTSIEL